MNHRKRSRSRYRSHSSSRRIRRRSRSSLQGRWSRLCSFRYRGSYCSSSRTSKKLRPRGSSRRYKWKSPQRVRNRGSPHKKKRRKERQLDTKFPAVVTRQGKKRQEKSKSRSRSGERRKSKRKSNTMNKVNQLKCGHCEV